MDASSASGSKVLSIFLQTAGDQGFNIDKGWIRFKVADGNITVTQRATSSAEYNVISSENNKPMAPKHDEWRGIA